MFVIRGAKILAQTDTATLDDTCTPFYPYFPTAFSPPKTPLTRMCYIRLELPKFTLYNGGFRKWRLPYMERGTFLNPYSVKDSLPSWP
jgi:hypothetical protein